MEVGGCLAVIAGSTLPQFLIATLFQTLPTSLHVLVVLLYFLSLIQKGYYQVPGEQDDIQKTAIITPFRMLEFLLMPFVLRNVGNTFQRYMDQILGDLNFCFVYVATSASSARISPFMTSPSRKFFSSDVRNTLPPSQPFHSQRTSLVS